MSYGTEREFSELLGKTLVDIKISNDERRPDEIVFRTNDGCAYRMWHQPDCCEDVYVEDIVGDIKDIVGSPITMAEEVISNENPEGVDIPEYQDSFTWTFYKLATVKGYVTIRWYGESNGYYSESVDFHLIESAQEAHNESETES